jgi:hypothetical protein
VIGDLALNHVERIALRCGFAVVRTLGSDYGIDLHVNTFDPYGQIEFGEILIQVKSTDRLPILGDGATISYTVATADLAYWKGENEPVILVIYDAVSDKAYWLDVQVWANRRRSESSDWRTKTVQIRIPLASRFTIRAMRGLQRRKNELKGMPGSHSRR